MRGSGERRVDRFLAADLVKKGLVAGVLIPNRRPARASAAALVITAGSGS